MEVYLNQNFMDIFEELDEKKRSIVEEFLIEMKKLSSDQNYLQYIDDHYTAQKIRMDENKLFIARLDEQLRVIFDLNIVDDDETLILKDILSGPIEDSLESELTNIHREQKIKSSLTVNIQLSEQSVRQLNKPVEGVGGFQSFLRKIKEQIDDQNRILLEKGDIEKVLKYYMNYGHGGWQSKLEEIFNNLEQFHELLDSYFISEEKEIN